MPGIGLREWHKRVAATGSAALALADIDEPIRDAALSTAQRAIERAATLGTQILTLGCDGYPDRLLDLSRAADAALSPAPPVLFALGNTGTLTQPAVAIVGTRHATATGLRAAERIAHDCADAGALVVSGLARGIDAAAHTGALDTNGATAAVIGTGIDIALPGRSPHTPAPHRQRRAPAQRATARGTRHPRLIS